MTEETKKLILQMAVGSILWELLLAVPGVLLAETLGFTRLSVILGLAAGWLASVAMLIHMALITERVVSTGDQSYANKTTVVQSLLRKFIYIVVLVLVLWKLPQVNALAMVLGTMGLKAGAYLQPFVDRLTTGERRNAYGNEHGNSEGS